MTFTAPFGLLCLLAIPAIVLLHLFRNRLPERRVSALFLFPVTPVLQDGGRTRTRLWRSPSLWLECLAALLASLWLAGWTFSDLLPRHVVLVLDDSASMAASGTRERVLVTVQRLLDDLGGDDEVTVVRTGVPAEVALGPRAQKGELLAAVARWRPGRPSHALQPALDLARDLAGHTGEVVFCTDEDPGLSIDDVRVVAHGEPRANAAITALRRVRSADRDRLLVSVTVFGDLAGSELRVDDGEQELLRVPLSLPPNGGEAQFALPLSSQHGARLRVALTDDALAIDNAAWLASEPERLVRIHDRLSADQRQRLRLDDVLAACDGWQAEADPTRAQVVLAGSPGNVVAGQLEVVIAASLGDRQAHRSPFVVDRSHALLAGMALDGIAWQSGSGDLPGQVLVASGDKVLCSEQWLAIGRRLWLDVDAAAGNLARSPDWPILFANVLEAGRDQAPGCRAHVVRVGEGITYRAGESRRALVVVDPAGQPVAALDAFGDVACIAELPGIYRVESPDGFELARIAANFVDPRESDLSRTGEFDRPPTVPAHAAGENRRDASVMRQWLAVLLLLVALCDWWWLHRQGA